MPQLIKRLKWHFKEVKVKDEIKYDTSFVPCESLKKTECTEDLEIFLTKAMEDSGAMKMKIFNKRHNYAAAFKWKLTSKPIFVERKKQ